MPRHERPSVMRSIATGRRRGTAALLVTFVLAGCGGSGADLRAGGTASERPATSTPPTGRDAAEQEASRLLALVTPPASATSMSDAPAPLTDAATRPNVDS